MSDDDLDDLRAELAEYAVPQKQGGRTAREERVIAGFEEIQRFVDTQGRPPQHGEGRDIFERLYAVRLDRIRAEAECRALVEPLDRQGLLADVSAQMLDDDISDDELLAELRGLAEPEDSITTLRHVRSSTERRAAEDIANRTVCKDFERFAPLFKQVQADLEAGVRVSRPFELKSEIEQGRFFIVGGLTAYVAEKEPEFTNAQGRKDARLRVIFSNKTESDLLMRSLQRALNEDSAGRRISEPEAGPLFTDTLADDDKQSGTIYVLRSKSDHPFVVQNRNLVHKIGVTTGSVEDRIRGAHLQPTFLLAGVEIIATYQLYTVLPHKLESKIHQLFGNARIDITIPSYHGRQKPAKEWFLVPLSVIDEAIKRIKDGSIDAYIYDQKAMKLIIQDNSSEDLTLLAEQSGLSTVESLEKNDSVFSEKMSMLLSAISEMHIDDLRSISQYMYEELDINEKPHRGKKDSMIDFIIRNRLAFIENILILNKEQIIDFAKAVGVSCRKSHAKNEVAEAIRKELAVILRA